MRAVAGDGVKNDSGAANNAVNSASESNGSKREAADSDGKVVGTGAAAGAAAAGIFLRLLAMAQNGE